VEYERAHETQFPQPSTVSLDSCVGRRQASPPPPHTFTGQHELTNIVSAFPRFAHRIWHRTGPPCSSGTRLLLPAPQRITCTTSTCTTKILTHKRDHHICSMLLSDYRVKLYHVAPTNTSAERHGTVAHCCRSQCSTSCSIQFPYAV
jgi:hypothetical protein